MDHRRRIREQSRRLALVGSIGALVWLILAPWAPRGGVVGAQAQEEQNENASTSSELPQIVVTSEQETRVSVTADSQSYRPDDEVEVVVRVEEAGDDVADLTLVVAGAVRMTGDAVVEIDDGAASFPLAAVTELDPAAAAIRVRVPDALGTDLVLNVELRSEAATTVTDPLVVPPLVYLERSEPVVEESQPGVRVVRHLLSLSANGAAQSVSVQDVRVDSTRPEPVGDILDGHNATAADSSLLIWDLGDLERGQTRLLEYQVVYRDASNHGDVTVAATASAFEADEFLAQADATETVRAPLLVLDPANPVGSGGDGSIAAGDRVRVEFTVENLGSATAKNIRVALAGADEALVTVEDQSQVPRTGTTSGGGVAWTNVELPPGDPQSFGFVVVVKPEVEGDAEVTHGISVSQQGDQVESGAVSYAISGPTTTTAGRAVEGTLLFVLVLIYILVAFLAFFLVLVIRKAGWMKGPGLEVFTVVNLLAALLILAFGSDIGEEGALSLLAAIAGYVLGRGISDRRGSDGDGKGPGEEPPPPAADGPPPSAIGVAATDATGPRRIDRISERASDPDRTTLRLALASAPLVLVLVVISVVWLVDASVGADLSRGTYLAVAVTSILIVLFLSIALVVIAHNGESGPPPRTSAVDHAADAVDEADAVDASGDADSD